MFHGFRGLGDDNSAGAAKAAQLPESILQQPQLNADKVSLDCQWCVENPVLSVFSPSCWALNDTVCVSTSVPKAYVKGAVPGMPPSQDVIDSQTPDKTINDILSQSQQNAINAALQAAAAQQEQAADPLIPPGVCVEDSDQYNALLCFLKKNSGTVFTLGLVLVGVALIAPSKGRR